jgi:hypothetical protein
MSETNGLRDIGSVHWTESRELLNNLYIRTPSEEMLQDDGYKSSYTSKSQGIEATIIYDRSYVLAWFLNKFLRPLNLAYWDLDGEFDIDLESLAELGKDAIEYAAKEEKQKRQAEINNLIKELENLGLSKEQISAKLK